MDKRQQDLLVSIAKQYLKTAIPVGSKLVEEKSRLGVSSATIRNEMAELEKEGYITQPHTSAGRIPTAKGYKYLLDHCFKACSLSNKEEQEIKSVFRDDSFNNRDYLVKDLAKKLAEFSGSAVLVGFSPENFYYTGLANLFNQPEFRSNPDLIYNLTLLIDHLDQAIVMLFNQINALEVRVGENNPFGQACGIVLYSWQFKKHNVLIGILGPLRMDYEKNLGLMDFIKDF